MEDDDIEKRVVDNFLFVYHKVESRCTTVCSMYFSVCVCSSRLFLALLKFFLLSIKMSQNLFRGTLLSNTLQLKGSDPGLKNWEYHTLLLIGMKEVIAFSE